MASNLERSDRCLDSEKVEVQETENALVGSQRVAMERFAHLDEKKILRKMDLHLIPVLTLLYLLSYLDRE